MLLAIRRRLHQLWCRVRRHQLDRDFDLELRSHIAISCDAKLRDGAAVAQARAATFNELGDLRRLREVVRAAREGTELRPLHASPGTQNSMNKNVLVASVALGLVTAVGIGALVRFTTSGWLTLIPLLALALFGPFVLRSQGLSWETRALFPAYAIAGLVAIGGANLLVGLHVAQLYGTSPPLWFSVFVALVFGLSGAWAEVGIVRGLYLARRRLRAN